MIFGLLLGDIKKEFFITASLDRLCKKLWNQKPCKQEALGYQYDHSRGIKRLRRYTKGVSNSHKDTCFLTLNKQQADNCSNTKN